MWGNISVCEALPHSTKKALPLVHRWEAHSGPCDGGTKLGLEHGIRESQSAVLSHVTYHWRTQKRIHQWRRPMDQPWMRGGWEKSGRCHGSAVVMPFNAQSPICLFCDPAVSMGLLKRLTHCTEHGRLRTNRCWGDLFIYFIVQLCVLFKTKDVQWFMSNNDSQRIEINSQNSPRVLDLFFLSTK